MVEQISLLPQVKQGVIISEKLVYTIQKLLTRFFH